MTKADRITVFKQTSSVSWPTVVEFFNEVAGELYQKSLKTRGAERIEALDLAQGAFSFLELLNQRIAGLQSEISDEKPQIEAPVDENAPLEIL